jgi:hypothetical protein
MVRGQTLKYFSGLDLHFKIISAAFSIDDE